MSRYLADLNYICRLTTDEFDYFRRRRPYQVQLGERNLEGLARNSLLEKILFAYLARESLQEDSSAMTNQPLLARAQGSAHCFERRPGQLCAFSLLVCPVLQLLVR